MKAHYEIAVSALSLKAAHSGLAKLIHSTTAFSLDWPVAEHNLQLNDLCYKNTRLVFRYEISVLLQ